MSFAHRIVKRGQSTLEFVMLLVIVIGAMVAMQMYIKRAIQGRWKDTMESIGEQYDPTAMVTNIRQSAEGFSQIRIYLQNGSDGIWRSFREDFSETTEKKKGSSRVTLY